MQYPRSTPNWLTGVVAEAALVIGFVILIAWAAPDLAAWVHSW